MAREIIAAARGLKATLVLTARRSTMWEGHCTNFACWPSSQRVTMGYRTSPAMAAVPTMMGSEMRRLGEEDNQTATSRVGGGINGNHDRRGSGLEG